MIPDTERATAPLLAAELSGERQAAANRHGRRIARVGQRTVRRWGRDVQEIALSELSAAELSAHFDDARTIGGAARGTLVRQHLHAASEHAGRRADARAPTARQEGALLAMEHEAMADVRVDWDELRGSPRRIAGALQIQRGAAPDDVGRGWVASHWPELAAALGADEHDELEFAAVGGLPDDLTTITYRRVRSGVLMAENLVELHVTNETHPMGAGLLLRVEAQWDTDVADGALRNDIDEGEAVARTGTRLGRTLSPDEATTELRWRCFRESESGPACRPTWAVTTEPDPEAVEATHGPEASGLTVYVDARTGVILATEERERHYNGHVSQNTRYAHETTDVQRDMRHGRLRQFCLFGWCEGETNSNGDYNWTPLGPSAEIGLRSGGASTIDFHHVIPPPPPLEGEEPESICAESTMDYQWQTFDLNLGANLVITPDAATNRRGDWLMFHYLNYSTDVYWQFSNVAEIPQTLWFNAGGGGGGAFRPCNGSSEFGYLTAGAGDDTGTGSSDIVLRDVFWEEVFHATDWCTQTVGAGCGWTLAGNRSALGSGYGHAAGGAIGSRLNQYETWARGMNSSNDMRYAGPNVPGDIMLYDDEIDGTPTSGIDGCDPNPETTGMYNCAANEACARIAMDRPRCMRRAPNPGDCATFFPNQPFVDRKPFGSDPTNLNLVGNEGPFVCISNDYNNGRLWLHLGEHLINSAGYLPGVGAFYKASRGLTRTREFTQGADNYHDVMAAWAGNYEASNAFHNVSTESFAWLDDTSDVWSRSEVIRVPRTGTLTFTNGGPTGTPLSFNQGLSGPGTSFDYDTFLIMVDQNETYEISVTTSSANVDLCVGAWNHFTSATIPQLPTHANGCTNGAGTAAARNHTFRFSTGTADVIDFLVRNLLSQTGTYQIQFRNVTDDYPDQLSYNFTSQPLRNAIATSGTLEINTDRDLFRYDAPAGTGGTLTISTTGAAANGIVQIFQSAAPAVPGGSAVAAGWGGASAPVTAGLTYYILVHAISATGAYTITASHSGCGTCNGNGTYAAPLPLASARGGIVTNRLDQSALAPGFDTWEACRDGLSCDWYSIVLVENERVTVSTFDVLDSYCDVEVGVLAPDELEYWRSSGVHAPMTRDLHGSMENNGSQLTFVAPRAGQYRIRLRAIHPFQNNCPRYQMAVSRGVQDYYAPPPIH